MEYKTRVYLITFSSYVGIHALRTTYSFSKGMIAQTVSVDDSKLGIVDSLMIYALALGFFQQAVLPFGKPVQALGLGLLLTSLFYLLIPICLSAYEAQSFALLCVLMTIDGYFQSFAWPNLLMLVNSQFDNKKEAIKLGIWSTNTNVGNIVGFVICQYLVLNTGLPWQISMVFISLFLIVNSILIFIFIKELPKTDTAEQRPASLALSEDEMKVQKKEMQILPNPMDNIAKLFKSPVVICLTLAFSFVKSIQYGILLWLPMYFDLKGLVDYSAYIPIAFDSASIVSSIALGFAFKQISNKGLLLGPLIFILMGLFFMLRYVDATVTQYFSMIAGVGLCLGGSYNTMSSLVAMELVKVVDVRYRTKYLGFYSAVLMCVANLITATTQILIGYVIADDQALIFTIFFWYATITLALLIAVGILQRARPPPEDADIYKYIQIAETH